MVTTVQHHDTCPLVHYVDVGRVYKCECPTGWPRREGEVQGGGTAKNPSLVKLLERLVKAYDGLYGAIVTYLPPEMRERDSDLRPALDAGEEAMSIARAVLSTFSSPVEGGESWQPTAENINALPDPVRDYIMMLETRCDPAGDTQELVLARETVKALERKLEELRGERECYERRDCGGGRGLVDIGFPVVDVDGSEVRVRTSSLATASAVRILTNNPRHDNLSPHLTVEQAREVAGRLLDWADETRNEDVLGTSVDTSGLDHLSRMERSHLMLTSFVGAVCHELGVDGWREGAGNEALEKVRTLMGSGGVALIAAERRRQVEEEGWTAEHDDQHNRGEMAVAAACYAVHDVGGDARHFVPWPWAEKWWKPGSYLRNLVRAGALIAAELDRVRRWEKKKGVGLSRELRAKGRR